jgi:hypothetical protein
MEVYEQDFTTADLQRLAARAADEAKRSASTQEGGAQTPESEDSAMASATAQPATVTTLSADAEACLAQVAQLGDQDRLVKVISAGFEGKPAFFGFYEHSPGAGQPADRLVVWVVDAGSCEPPALASATQRI